MSLEINKNKLSYKICIKNKDKYSKYKTEYLHWLCILTSDTEGEKMEDDQLTL